MTDWLGIIERAAYTRFSKTGSLEPFLLVRRDLVALMSQASGWHPKELDGFVRIQVRVPVPTIQSGVLVLVDEWI